MITKGTTVKIKTTNGGAIVAPLVENHRPTYDAIIASGNSYVVISSYRIVSVEVA